MTEHVHLEGRATAGIGPTHLDLLAVAQGVRQAAVDDDLDRLHAELARLRSALLEHVSAEAATMSSLAPGAATVVAEGQRRLLRRLDEVLFESADTADGGDSCTCLVRAAEIELALRRQAMLEAALRTSR